MILPCPIIKPLKALTEAHAMGVFLLMMLVLFPRITLGTLGMPLCMFFRDLNKN